MAGCNDNFNLFAARVIGARTLASILFSVEVGFISVFLFLIFILKNFIFASHVLFLIEACSCVFLSQCHQFREFLPKKIAWRAYQTPASCSRIFRKSVKSDNFLTLDWEKSAKTLAFSPLTSVHVLFQFSTFSSMISSSSDFLVIIRRYWDWARGSS